MRQRPCRPGRCRCARRLTAAFRCARGLAAAHTQGCRSPRSQAGKHLPDQRRPGKDTRLRAGQADAARGEATRPRFSYFDGPVGTGLRPRHGRLHVARASAWPGCRPGFGSVQLRRILYEMLTGKRAFRGGNRRRHDERHPEGRASDLAEANRLIPPALERIVRHCLEKNPEERFQSARDIAFDLEALSSASGTQPVAPYARFGPKTRRLRFAVIGLAILTAFAAGALLIRSKGTATQSHLSSPDIPPGHHPVRAIHSRWPRALSTVRTWEGNRPEIFTTRPQSPESRSSGLAGSSLLSVSRMGEIAVLMGTHPIAATYNAGTLARVPLEGGAPREILGNAERLPTGPLTGRRC